MTITVCSSNSISITNSNSSDDSDSDRTRGPLWESNVAFREGFRSIPPIVMAP